MCFACFFLPLAAAPLVRLSANIASLLRIYEPGRKIVWDILENGTWALHRTTYKVKLRGVGQAGPAARWLRAFAVGAADERRLASERGIIIMHLIGIVASFQPE